MIRDTIQYITPFQSSKYLITEMRTGRITRTAPQWKLYIAVKSSGIAFDNTDPLEPDPLEPDLLEDNSLSLHSASVQNCCHRLSQATFSRGGFQFLVGWAVSCRGLLATHTNIERHLTHSMKDELSLQALVLHAASS